MLSFLDHARTFTSALSRGRILAHDASPAQAFTDFQGPALMVDNAATGRYPEATTRPLTAAKLGDKTAETLSMMRNEVFARPGHRFKSKSLADHFGFQSWYKAQVDDASSLLTELERKNVALIRQQEKLLTA